MKRITYIIALSVSALSMFIACDKQDDTYSQYIVPGGYNYPAKATEVTAQAGYYRVDVSWATPLDPAVKSVKLYWDSKRDSMTVNYADAVDGIVTAHVSGLEERSYTFSIVNFDANGNKSLASEVTVSPYGNGWLSTHAERKVYSAVMKGEDALLSLGTPVDEMVYTKFRFKNSEGQVVESDPIPMDSTDVYLTDAMKGKYFEYQSAYCPKNGLDIVWSSNWIKTNNPIYYNLANSDWKVTVTTSQMRNADFGPEKMFDGDLTTRYYSSTNTSIRKNFPKIVAVNTSCPEDAKPTVTAVNLIQHQTESKSRFVKTLNFYVGDDAYDPNDSAYLTSFGAPVLEASFRQDMAEQNKEIAPATGSCFAIAFKSSYSTYGYIDVLEFEIIGYVAANAD